jgi:hypothetical protein
MRCDRSVAKAVGWLVQEGRASALQSIKVPQILDALTQQPNPAEFGFLCRVTQPRLADNSKLFRAIGSEIPCLSTKEQFDAVLPRRTVGASSTASLEVLMMGGLFNEDTGFFRGLCETPQADEDALFAHPAVKAGVLVKWEHYAQKKFFVIFVGYISFMATFTAWTLAETAEDLHESPWPRRWRIASAVGAVCFLGVEAKQVIRTGLRSYAKDNWNYLALFVFLSTCVSTVLSEPMLHRHNDMATQSQNSRSVVAVAAWIQLLAYLRGFPSFSPYVRMLSEIVADAQSFLLIYGVIIFAFAHGTLLFSEDLHCKSISETVENILHALLGTYRMGTLGDFESGEFEGHWQRYLLFFACTVTITVVLLNVLIAVISDTFDRLQERAESSSVKGRVQLIAEIESIFGVWDPPAYILFSRIGEKESDEWSGRIGALKDKIEKSKSDVESKMNEMRLKTESKMNEMRFQIESKIDRIESKIDRIEVRN